MKDFEDEIRTYLTERGWDNLRPADLAKSIMIEGGELLELFQWDNVDAEKIKADKSKLEEIKKELADVLIYCFDMAVILDIDVKEMLQSKLAKIREKYPTHLFNKDSNPNDPGTEDIYWKIKAEHRQKGI